jgi:pimeloyl-ACP methyl ester carboxylesterase
MFKKLLILLLPVMLQFTVRAQQLPRKIYHGVAITAINDSVKKATGLTAGLHIDKILPEGTIARTDIAVGDILLSVNDSIVRTSTELSKLYIQEGFAVRYHIYRAGKKRIVKGIAQAKPEEKPSVGDTRYVTVPFGKNRLRGILNIPSGTGPFPAVLFIQGYTCSPVCDLPDWHPYRRIPEGLAANGYIVLRIEKPGIGESDGPTVCEDMDLLTEAKGFESGLDYLHSLPEVKKEKVFVYGHSLGGIVAPLLDKNKITGGIAAYGTSHEPWFEYLIQMIRYQNPNLGADYLENEVKVRKYHRLLFELMENKKLPREVCKIDTSYERIMREDLQYDGGRRLFGRDASVFWDLNTVNLPERWASFGKPVLILYGTADIEVMTPDASKEIIAIVNRYHPGTGTFRELVHTNHSFAKVGPMEVEYIHQQEGLRVNDMKEKFNEDGFRYFVEWAGK